MIDAAWLEGWLLRLHRTKESGDVFARRAILKEADEKPECEGVALVAEIMMVWIDGEVSARKAVSEILERVAATRGITVNANHIDVGPGGVVGVDSSGEKSTDVGKR